MTAKIPRVFRSAPSALIVFSMVLVMEAETSTESSKIIRRQPKSTVLLTVSPEEELPSDEAAQQSGNQKVAVNAHGTPQAASFDEDKDLSQNAYSQNLSRRLLTWRSGQAIKRNGDIRGDVGQPDWDADEEEKADKRKREAKLKKQQKGLDWKGKKIRPQDPWAPESCDKCMECWGKCVCRMKSWWPYLKELPGSKPDNDPTCDCKPIWPAGYYATYPSMCQSLYNLCTCQPRRNWCDGQWIEQPVKSDKWFCSGTKEFVGTTVTPAPTTTTKDLLGTLMHHAKEIHKTVVGMMR